MTLEEFLKHEADAGREAILRYEEFLDMKRKLVPTLERADIPNMEPPSNPARTEAEFLGNESNGDQGESGPPM